MTQEYSVEGPHTSLARLERQYQNKTMIPKIRNVTITQGMAIAVIFCFERCSAFGGDPESLNWTEKKKKKEKEMVIDILI